MSPLVLAIDPGASGAACLFGCGSPIHVVPFVSYQQMARAFHPKDGLLNFAPLTIVIESVHASPVMSPSSAFAFGENFGFYRGLLAGRTLYGVTPSQWQAPLRIGPLQGDERKRALKQAASEGFPTTHVTLATADAILIADYVAREIATKGEFTSGKIL